MFRGSGFHFGGSVFLGFHVSSSRFSRVGVAGSGFWVRDFMFRAFMVQGFEVRGFAVRGFGFGVSRFVVPGLGFSMFWVVGSGFRVQGVA